MKLKKEKKNQPESKGLLILPYTFSFSISPSFSGTCLRLCFAINTSSIYWPVLASNFLWFWLWTCCQFNPAPFPLFWASSRECWVPAQCRFWNTDFLPGSAGPKLPCECSVALFHATGSGLWWALCPDALWCSLPLAPIHLGLHPWVPAFFVIVLFGLEVLYKKLQWCLFWFAGKRVLKVPSLKKKLHLIIFPIVFIVFKSHLKVKELKETFLSCLLCLKGPPAPFSFILCSPAFEGLPKSQTLGEACLWGRPFLYLVTQHVCTSAFRCNLCCLSG